MSLRTRIAFAALLGTVACSQLLELDEFGSEATGTGGNSTAAAGGDGGTAVGGAGASAQGGAAGELYFRTVMSDSPCGYWRLGETMLPVAKDSSGYGNDGLYQQVRLGAPGAIDADPDTAAVFDGVMGTKLEISGDFHFTGTSPFSVELWVNPPSFAGGYPTAIGQFEDLGSNMVGWWIYVRSDATVFRREDGVSASSAVGDPLIPSEFTHVVAIYDGANIQLYLNAELQDTTASSLQIGDHQQPLVVGGRYTDYAPLAATIDEVAIYCTALSPAAVAAHHNAAIRR